MRKKANSSTLKKVQELVERNFAKNSFMLYWRDYTLVMSFEFNTNVDMILFLDDVVNHFIYRDTEINFDYSKVEKETTL
jgi:hypothetical protein